MSAGGSIPPDHQLQGDAPAAVAVRGLRHSYDGRVALDGVELSIAPGQITGLLGPNGSGKSTLFRVLATLIPPQEGSIRIFGRDPTGELASVRRMIGVVFQSPAVDRVLSCVENLTHQGHLYGLCGADLRARIDRALGLVGMSEHARRRVGQLSGGQRRRVELAKALLHDPQLLLLDEPSTGLDPAARLEFGRHLESLRAEGRTVILTTHLMDEAERCDRLAILDAGRVIADDRPDALRRRVGSDVLAVETPEPAAAAEILRRTLGLGSRAVDGVLYVESPDPAARLPAVANLLRDRATGISLRRPTLNDVFLALTGRAFD